MTCIFIFNRNRINAYHVNVTIFIVDLIQNDSVLTVLPTEVTRLPLHSTACGKVFLANMTEEEKRKYQERLNV